MWTSSNASLLEFGILLTDFKERGKNLRLVQYVTKLIRRGFRLLTHSQGFKWDTPNLKAPLQDDALPGRTLSQTQVVFGSTSWCV